MVEINEDLERGPEGAGTKKNPSDEQSPLLRPRPLGPSTVASEPVTSDEPLAHKSRKVAGLISCLLIGVFIPNADGSILFATNGTISSHFSQLEHASWLSTSYLLAMCGAQPILGKLSDVFGRKAILLLCYSIFGIGTLISGIGQQLWQVILGRTIAGIGGSGMSVVVSILITDLVPKINIAIWRSYVNISATVGRSLGGPVGGWLTDAFGWRWSFIGQVPLVALAFILVAWGLDDGMADQSKTNASIKSPSKLNRIDFGGAVLISSAIVIFLLAVDLPGQGRPWTDTLVLSLICLSVLFGTVFLFYEGKYAREPIFPPRLLTLRDVATSYSISALQVGAQTSIMFSIPLYFQITEGASNARAGSHLVPAVIGNAIGGLMSGYLIKRTGRYKSLALFAGVSAMASYALIIFRWGNHTSLLDSLEIFPGGFGTGIIGASTFIALTSNIAHADMAVATSGLYLSLNVGMALGLSLSSSVQKWGLHKLLVERLTSPSDEKVIRHILSDVNYIKNLHGEIHDKVLTSYVESLSYSHTFSLASAAASFLVSFMIRENSLVE